MDKRSGLQPSKVALSVALAITFSSPALSSILDATNTLYYYASNNSNGNNSDFTNYEQVNIKTNAIASTNGLKGWGIYLDRTGYKFNTLNIVTNGMLSDGIHSKNAGGLIEINDYEVLTTSYSSDGINLGRELASNSSKVLINNTATIKAAGMGVRANASVNNANAVSTIIINGKTAIETTSAGSNVAGYGVYAGKDTEANSTAVKGRAEIFLNGDSTIKTVGNNAHAVYARDAGTISLNNVTISASGNNAHGLFASSPTPDQQAVINLASDVSIITHTGNVIYATGEHGVIQSYDSASAQPASGVYRLDGNIVADNGGQVTLNMAEGSHFTGVANSNELPTSSSAAGKITLSLSGANSLWHMTGDSVLSSLTLNDAVLNYAAPAEGDAFTPKTLVVAGNYGGQGGVLALNTVLGDDNSLTDKLVVMGDTDGSTKVRINNLGGGGAQTVEGIEIIEVAGESNGIFEKEGRIVAGAYDYDVRKKAGNWYLTSLLPTEPDPEPDPEPIPEPIPEPEPEPGPVPGPEPEPTPTPEPGGRHQVRPEFGSYLANLYSANTLFATRLHDRLGETQYTDLLTGEQRVTSMWMRHVGGHTRFNDATGTLKTQSNRYVLQIGGDIAQWQSAGSDRWHLGLMAGYGNSQSNTRSTLNNYRSTGKVTGYSAGLYTTWYANEADKTGTYLDAWALYNWFDNQVTGQGLATEKYKSKGVSASLEAGYSARAGESASGHYSWWLQPKAQVTWMGVKADDHKEANGTRVKDTTRGNLQTRLGLKAYATENVKQKAPREQDFQPFIEANWIHNADDYSVKMDGVENTIRGTKNIGELKLGLEGQIGKNVQLWGNVAQQIGDKGYSDTQGIVGFKYLF